MAEYEIGITAVNTQVRRLGYLSAIASILGNKTLNEAHLYKQLERWSVAHKPELDAYINQQGYIKPTLRTSGAKRYTGFYVSLGLAGRVAGARRLTRFGKTVLPFLKAMSDRNPFELSLAEQCFYLHWLLIKDTDRLLTVFDMLADYPNRTLANLQAMFRDRYVERLDARISSEPEWIARDILVVRNRAAHLWKNPERYAENIVPPRVHWLLDLGLARIMDGKTRPASLSESGDSLRAAFPRVANSEWTHVDTKWIQSSFFTSVGPALAGEEGYRWDQMSQEDRDRRLFELIRKSFDKFGGSGVPKITLYPALTFMSLSLAQEQRIWANFDELRAELKSGKEQDGVMYEIRFSQRENESYLISTRRQ